MHCGLTEDTDMSTAHPVDCTIRKLSLSVLWSFENDKIASGRHLAADQDALDAFFTTFPS